MLYNETTTQSIKSLIRYQYLYISDLALCGSILILKRGAFMEQIITPLLNEVTSLPLTMQVMAVSALGMLGIWMAMRHIDKNAGCY